MAGNYRVRDDVKLKTFLGGGGGEGNSPLGSRLQDYIHSDTPHLVGLL